MLRTWLSAALAFALLISRCHATETHGANSQELADAVRWAAQEPSDAARRFLPGLNYPAVVRRCLARDQNSFQHLFGLSVHTDAAASELQAGILAIVLKQVGDDFFAARLMEVTRPARNSSLDLLRYELLTETPPPYGMRLSDYPKIMRLFQRCNQSLEPTAGRRDAHI
jgi:hypothetical protein